MTRRVDRTNRRARSPKAEGTLRLTPELQADLRIPELDGEVVAFGAAFDGSVYVVLAIEPLDYSREQPGWAIFPKTEPDVPQRYRLVAVAPDGSRSVVPVDDEAFNIHFAQPLSGRLLLACARSNRRSDTDIEQNGRIHGSDGRFSRGIILGDGIQGIQTTSTGTIWVSYFDEGIFGNFGWDEPLGASGLVAWDSRGNRLYEYAPAAGLGSMDDCYALNVASDDDVWCYYYSDFPLVHIRCGQVVERWSTPLSGADAFAVTDQHVLFHGGYKNGGAYTLCTLLPTSLKVSRRFTLVDSAGAAIKADRVAARGDSLFVLAARQVYRLRVGDAARAA